MIKLYVAMIPSGLVSELCVTGPKICDRVEAPPAVMVTIVIIIQPPHPLSYNGQADSETLQEDLGFSSLPILRALAWQRKSYMDLDSTASARWTGAL